MVDLLVLASERVGRSPGEVAMLRAMLESHGDPALKGDFPEAEAASLRRALASPAGEELAMQLLARFHDAWVLRHQVSAQEEGNFLRGFMGEGGGLN